MTDAELTRLLELWEGTTAGPWFWNGYSQIQSAALVNEYNRLEAEVPDDAPEENWPKLPQVGVLYAKAHHGDTPTPQGEADLRFVEAVHTALPALVAEVRRLTIRCDRLDDYTEHRVFCPVHLRMKGRACECGLAELEGEAE